MENLFFINKITGIAVIVIGLLIVLLNLGSERSSLGGFMFSFVGVLLIILPALFSTTNSMATNVANKLSDAPIEQKADNNKSLVDKAKPAIEEKVEPNGKIND